MIIVVINIISLSPSDFVLSYAKNGELLQWIRKVGCFDEECTRFYAAELVIALEFMHSKGVIHRYDFHNCSMFFNL